MGITKLLLIAGTIILLIGCGQKGALTHGKQPTPKLVPVKPAKTNILINKKDITSEKYSKVKF